MNSRAPEHLRRMRHAVAAHGTSVTLTWVETTGGTIDPVTRAPVGGVTQTKTATAKALVHHVAASSALRQHVEIEVGDVILDFDPTVALDGKEGLTFTVDGTLYVQKDLGEKLSTMWDALFMGKRMLRTVLVRRAT